MIIRRVVAGAAAAALLGSGFAVGPVAAKDKGETTLTLRRGFTEGMDAAGVGIKGIRGGKLTKAGVMTFPVTGFDGKVITHKGALLLSTSAGFVTMQNLAVDYRTGKTSALVQFPMQRTEVRVGGLLTFKAGTRRIAQNGIWKNATVALSTASAVGDPAPLMAELLGLPRASIPTGMKLGKADIVLR